MLSQYYLIVDANTLTAGAAPHSRPQDGLLHLQEIQKALSLSLNLYALAQQELKVRGLADHHSRPLPTPALSSPRINPSLTENNPISTPYKNVSEKNNSSVVGDYFCKTYPESPRAATVQDQKCADLCQEWLQQGSARGCDGKIKIKKVSSGRLRRNRARMVLRRARVGAETTKSYLRRTVELPLRAATIEGRLGGEALKEKRDELMRRWVRSWNPDKDETYIKNREFRMLLRN